MKLWQTLNRDRQCFTTVWSTEIKASKDYNAGIGERFRKTTLALSFTLFILYFFGFGLMLTNSLMLGELCVCFQMFSDVSIFYFAYMDLDTVCVGVLFLIYDYYDDDYYYYHQYF